MITKVNNPLAEKSDTPHRVLTLNKYSLTDYGIDKVVNTLCLDDEVSAPKHIANVCMRTTYHVI